MSNLRTPWTIGEEREIAPGAYARLIDQIEGWRLWWFEEKTGSVLMACKSADAHEHLRPLGVGAAFYGSAPAVTLRIEDDAPRAHIHTSFYFRRAIEVRLPGERFYSDFKAGLDLRPLDGATIEISATSSELDRASSKVALDRGNVNLTGIVAIVELGQQQGRLSAP